MFLRESFIFAEFRVRSRSETLDDNSRCATATIANSGNADVCVLLLKHIDQCDDDARAR
jgi:hypothetical protein